MNNLLKVQFLKKRLQEIERYLESFLDFEPEFISQRALFNLQAGGKRLRPVFIVLAAEYYQKYDEDIIRAASIMELIHMSSLIHDDINDRSALRRGQDTINAVYGNDVAVFVGDYVLTKAMKHVYSLPHHERILAILAETAVEMSKGELVQIDSMFDLDQQIHQYYYRIERKTALLIAVCCQIGAILGDAPAEEEKIFYDYGYHLGMAFQIKDDLMDLLQNPHDLGKPTGKDLETGLINLPTILALQKEFPEKEDVLQRIRMAFPEGAEDVRYVSDVIIEQGGIRDSERILKEHIQEAKACLKRLKHKKVIGLLQEGADYINERSY